MSRVGWQKRVSYGSLNHVNAPNSSYQKGERAKERGGGLSENMSTQLSGMLMEDVEVSSVEDLGVAHDRRGKETIGRRGR
jgi:hypothetical protein